MMNRLKLILPLLFALVLCVGMAKAITTPPGIVTYIPITFTNKQASPVVANTPLSFVFDASRYQQYETSTLNNTEIFFANGTVAKSWLAGNYSDEEQQADTFYTSSNIIYWFVSPEGFLAADTGTAQTNTVYLGFAGNTPTTSNLLWSMTDGVAPQITCGAAYPGPFPSNPLNCIPGNGTKGIYAEYDNGNAVFNAGGSGLYDNFAGSTINGTLWNTVGTPEVGNEITLISHIGGETAVISKALFNPDNSIFDALMTLSDNSGTALCIGEGFASTLGAVGSSCTPGPTNGILLSAQDGISPTLFLTSAAGVSPIPIYPNFSRFSGLEQLETIYANTTNATAIFSYSGSTNGEPNAGSSGYYAPYSTSLHIILMANDGPTSRVFAQFVRVRIAPPDDIMPSASFGSLDGAPATGPTLSVSGTTAAEVGQRITLNATPGFTSYQWYNDTGAVPAAITGATTNAYNTTAGAIGTFNYYVIVTGSNSTIKSSPDSKVTVSAVPDLGPPPVNLGSAGNFVILAESGITTTGTTSIIGNIGVSPITGASMTGFGLALDPSGQFATSSLVTGNVYAADYSPPTPAMMTAAVNDMQTAYADAAGRADPSNTDLDAGNIGGLTLYPGLYKWSTAVAIPTSVTLNCEGDTKSVFIFQIAGGLNTGSGAAVNLSGGCQSQNIFWQVAGGVTLGATSSFKGIILSQTSIVMGAGDVLDGRALAQTAVTLNADNVTAPIATASPQPTITLSASTPTTINATQNVTFTNVTTSGTPPYTYSYNVMGGHDFTVSGNKIIFNAAGNYVVNETVIDSIGANSTSNNISISVNPEFTVSISVSNLTIVAGNSTTLTASAVNGSSPYTYQWYNGTLCHNTSLITGANTSVYSTPILTSTSSYCVVATDSLDANTISTATVTVATPAPPPVPSISTYTNGTESGWQVSNLTINSSETLILNNQTIQLAVNFITPTGAGITVNNQTYSLTTGNPTPLTNIINSTDIVVLENPNTTPALPTMTLLMYETSTLNATAQRPPASEPSNSAIAALASITASGKWYIVAAIIIIIIAIVIILFSSMRSRRMRTNKADARSHRIKTNK
jgi:hypothetical protein